MSPPMRITFSYGQVSHEVVGPSAVPVFLPIGRVDDIAGVECDDVFAPHQDQTPTFGYIQSLAAVM
jgi:hypothetical protein